MEREQVGGWGGGNICPEASDDMEPQSGARGASRAA